ncbi:hypothetical protein CCYS_12555 [Corynebacterium cystitidis DSM 20524]|nr:hypothetical protein CCYS_12555 [Corynebacterium cystitidis DSM 20524]
MKSWKLMPSAGATLLWLVRRLWAPHWLSARCWHLTRVRLAASIGADCPYEGIAEWLKSLVDDVVIQVAPGYTAGTA